MNLDTKGILVSMFQLAEKGELTKLEQKDVVDALYSFGMSRIANRLNDDINDTSSLKIDEDFKRIRLGTRTLLEQTEQCIDTALGMLKSLENYTHTLKDELKDLPEFAVIGDDKETIDFIKSLSKDAYNFSQAEKLTGITRQTIKIHADKEKHELKAFTIGKSQYISKETLVNYYRAYFNKDGFNH